MLLIAGRYSSLKDLQYLKFSIGSTGGEGGGGSDYFSSYFSRNCCTGKETECNEKRKGEKCNVLDCTGNTVIIITSKLIVFVS